jgi:hypothetical protein
MKKIRGRPLDGRTVNRPIPSAPAEGDVVFRYHLVDVAGRDVDDIARQVPLRSDETIIDSAGNSWRIVSVLGKSATVARV